MIHGNRTTAFLNVFRSGIFTLPLIMLAASPNAAGQPKTPSVYYSAPPEVIVEEMRQTPRLSQGATAAQLIELNKAVEQRALACDSMFNDDRRMQERIASWPRPQQVNLANECRRIIADYNAIQAQIGQLKRAEQEQRQRAEQAQAARNAEEARKAEAARVAEQREAFLARRPDFLVVLNPSARAFEVTKSLDGKPVISQKSRPVVVDFVRASAQSSNILIERFEKLPAPWLTELKSTVSEIGKSQGLALDTKGLDAREARQQSSRKCVAQSATQSGQRGTVADDKNAGAPERICPELTIGLIDRAEISRIQPLIDRGQILVLGEIRSAQVQARLDAAARKRAEVAAAEEAQRKAIIAQLETQPNAFMAIIVSDNKKPASCTIKSRPIEGAVRSAGGYATLPDFSKAARLQPDWRFDEVTEDLEKLWALVQKGSCSGLIVTGKEAGTLLPAFDREKIRYALLPPRDTAELHIAYARVRGFATVAQLDFASELKANASDIKTLAEFSIFNVESHRAAINRMQKSGYSKSSELSDLIAFLQDEDQGAKNKRTALQVRAARVAADEARERERAEKIQREMPLYSVQLMCREPMGHLTETLIGHLARSPAVFVQMISGSVRQYCQQVAWPVSNPDLIAAARKIDGDSSGAEYFVAKAPDGQSVLGLVKRRGN